MIVFLVIALLCFYYYLSDQQKKVIFEQVSSIKNKILTKQSAAFGYETILNAENPLTALYSRFKKKYLATNLMKDQSWFGTQNYIDYTIINLGLKPLVNVAPLRPEFGIVVNNVTAFKYPINIPKCRTDSIAKRTLFLGIWSAPDNVYSKKRKLIRQTWLKHIKDPHYNRGLLDVIGYGFIIGQTLNQTAQREIEEESKKYGDILQVEMNDTYRNLTRKTEENCIHLQLSQQQLRTRRFRIKIDDDVYVNVHNFATVLADLPPTEVSIYGHICGFHSVPREPEC